MTKSNALHYNIANVMQSLCKKLTSNLSK